MTCPGLAPHARDVARALLVAVIGWFAVATPALAKMPYFSIEVETVSPVQGVPFAMTVRMFQSRRQSILTDWFAGTMAGLVAVVPGEGVAGAARPVPVRLIKIGPATYRGTVVIDRPGRWILRAFPDRSGWASPELPPGYPADIVLHVRPAGPDPAMAALILGAIGAAAAGGLMLTRRRSAPAWLTS